VLCEKEKALKEASAEACDLRSCLSQRENELRGSRQELCDTRQDLLCEINELKQYKIDNLSSMRNEVNQLSCRLNDKEAAVNEMRYENCKLKELITQQADELKHFKVQLREACDIQQSLSEEMNLLKKQKACSQDEAEAFFQKNASLQKKNEQLCNLQQELSQQLRKLGD